MSSKPRPLPRKSRRVMQPVAERPKRPRTTMATIGRHGAPLSLRRRTEMLTQDIQDKLDRLDSQFKFDMDSIYETLDEAPPDIVQMTYLTASLTAIVRMIPVMEHKALRTGMPNIITAFNSLLEQGSKMSERMQKTDARIKSSENMIHLLEKVVDSHYQAVGSQLVSALSLLRNDLQSHVDDDSVIRARFHALAEDVRGDLETSKQSMKDAVNSALRSNVIAKN